MTCAWCDSATGELLVPGARGAFVHPSCEASRRGRRWFLGALGLAGAAVAAAPLLKLVPEAGALGTIGPNGLFRMLVDPLCPPGRVYLTNANVIVAELERIRPMIRVLYERDSTIMGYMMAHDQAMGRLDRAVRLPVRLSPDGPSLTSLKRLSA